MQQCRPVCSQIWFDRCQALVNGCHRSRDGHAVLEAEERSQDLQEWLQRLRAQVAFAVPAVNLAIPCKRTADEFLGQPGFAQARSRR